MSADGTVTVHVPTALRGLVGGERTIDVRLDPGDRRVVALLDALAERHPALARRVRDESGALRQHVKLFIGADDVRDLGGTEAVVPVGAEVWVLPAVSGGA